MEAPAGAWCGRHGDAQVSAMSVCERCGTFICGACTRWNEQRQTFCASCMPTDHVLASVGDRFVANLVDGLVIWLPAGVAFVIALVATGFEKQSGELALLGIMVGACGLVMLGLGAQLYFQVQHGRSIGKWLMGIRVVRKDGTPAEVWRVILLRNLAVNAMAQACGLVGLIDALMIFGAERRCLHDLIADTIVVTAPRS